MHQFIRDLLSLGITPGGVVLMFWVVYVVRPDLFKRLSGKKNRKIVFGQVKDDSDALKIVDESQLVKAAQCHEAMRELQEVIESGFDRTNSRIDRLYDKIT